MKLENGHRVWRNKDGQYHRTDGPAIECVDGTKYWCINGQLHRTDGPAVEWADGSKVWWINDQNKTNEIVQWMKETNITYPFDNTSKLLFKLIFG